MPEQVQAKAPVQGSERSASAGPEMQGTGIDLQQGMIPRAFADPGSLTPNEVIYLQRAAGNRAVSHLLGKNRAGAPVQSKSASSLRVGPMDDVYEREADHFAQQVVSHPSLQRSPQSYLQRLADAPAGPDAPIGNEGGATSGDFEKRVLSNSHSGKALPKHLRRTLEPKLGADLSSVRIHTDHQAVQLSRDINAKAFTHKQHIYYGVGQSPNNLRLTAHEMVHTLQQGAVRRTPHPHQIAISHMAKLMTQRSPAAYLPRVTFVPQAAPLTHRIQRYLEPDLDAVVDDNSVILEDSVDDTPDSPLAQLAETQPVPEPDAEPEIEKKTYTIEGEAEFHNRNANITKPNRNATGYKYLNSRQIGKDYLVEAEDSTEKVKKLISTIAKPVAKGEFGGDIGTAMKSVYGWSDDDVTKYIEGDKLREGVTTKVEYLRRDDGEREKYLVTGGSTLKQGKENFDTSKMHARKAGAGSANYVMSQDGRIYSGSSKAGLFHHSSFLGGGSTFGAGEWKVENGILKEINNKSGHYETAEVQLVQTLTELKEMGVNLIGVTLFTVDKDDKLIKFNGSASEFQLHKSKASVLGVMGTDPVKAQIEKTTSNTTGRQYPQERTMGAGQAINYTMESENTNATINVVIESIFTSGEYKKYESPQDAVTKFMGWSNSDLNKLDKDKLAAGWKNPKSPPADYFVEKEIAQVKYVDQEEERAQYEVTGGAPLKQKNVNFDTNEKFAKFGGAGWAMYVMSPDGRLYSDSSKVGLVHHSTFLAGGNVAGAGEWKVSGGTVKEINNKSGHYMPKSEQVVQTLLELERRGASLAGIQIPQIMTAKTEANPNGIIEYKKSAAEYVNENRFIGLSAETVKPSLTIASSPAATGATENKEGNQDVKGQSADTVIPNTTSTTSLSVTGNTENIDGNIDDKGQSAETVPPNTTSTTSLSIAGNDEPPAPTREAIPEQKWGITPKTAPKRKPIPKLEVSGPEIAPEIAPEQISSSLNGNAVAPVFESDAKAAASSDTIAISNDVTAPVENALGTMQQEAKTVHKRKKKSSHSKRSSSGSRGKSRKSGSSHSDDRSSELNDLPTFAPAIAPTNSTPSRPKKSAPSFDFTDAPINAPKIESTFSPSRPKKNVPATVPTFESTNVPASVPTFTPTRPATQAPANVPAAKSTQAAPEKKAKKMKKEKKK